MSERKKQILFAVVEQYIEHGGPVSSKGLCASLGLPVSSATIRSEMAELSEMGLIEQPYTSAGRIPTQAGYRYYVDHLMNRSPLTPTERQRIDSEFEGVDVRPEDVLDRAGRLLADMTNCAAISTMPSGEGAFLRRIEMVPIGERLIMLVILTSTGIVKNKVCRVREALSPALMEFFYKVAVREFVGQPIDAAYELILSAMPIFLRAETMPLSPLFSALAELSRDAANSEVMPVGQSNLLNHKELNTNAYELIKFLNEKESMNKLLSSGQNALYILIGRENMYRELENSSIIIARYKINGLDGGSLGIIGPTRINYAKLVPSLSYLTEIVGRLLSDNLEDQ